MSESLAERWIRSWSRRFEERGKTAILNSCDRPDELGTYALILAWGDRGFDLREDRFEPLERWIGSNPKNWIFGVLSYDLKNDLEGLETRGVDPLDMPSISVFAAQQLVVFYREAPEVPVLVVGNREEFDLMCAECAHPESEAGEFPSVGLRFVEALERAHYLNAVEQLLENIAQGDVYELNFCRSLTAEIPSAGFDPGRAYLTLCAKNPSAQSVFFRDGERGLISASPERFLIKKGRILSSQPIKGTAARNSDPVLDQRALQALVSSPKERAENIMVVDLVRNDFAKIASPGSIEVPDLCASRTLAGVHQMYSTIRCALEAPLDFISTVKSCFPMASMTGMPKVSAMEHAERHEGFRRAWYSGSFFYLKPNGDFDCNVVIRSLVYRLDLGLVSLAAGGAITALSNPDEEWRETEHKANSVFRSIDATVTPVTSGALGSV